MIGSLSGEVLDRHGTELIVEVSGIGYRVQVTPDTAAGAQVGSSARLQIHHHRREDAEILYGFDTLEDRRVFETLIGTHGVGPSLALAILSVHSPISLSEAVATDDLGALCLVPGVGRKTATRLLVELKSTLTVTGVELRSGASQPGVVASVRTDVRDALSGLGYGPEEIARVLPDLSDDRDTGELLREALKLLAVS